LTEYKCMFSTKHLVISSLKGIQYKHAIHINQWPTEYVDIIRQLMKTTPDLWWNEIL
jgi:hypothetical protein